MGDLLALSQYLESRMTDEGKRYYIFLDEIQFVGRKKLQSDPDIFITFYDVLNGLLEKGNADIYVTGSNSKMLSHFKDIVERNKIAFPEVLGMLADELCSSVGSLTNSSRIADTLQSVRKLKIDSETIGAANG